MKIILLPLLLSVVFAMQNCTSSKKENGNNKGNNVAVENTEISDTLLTVAPDSLAPGDYINWLNDRQNGFSLVKQIDPYIYNIQYTTPEYEAIKAIGKNRISEKEWNEILKEKQNNIFFNLKISRKDGQDVIKALEKSGMDKNKIATYLHFGFQKEVMLLYLNDSIPCDIYFYQPSQGILPYHEFILAFSGVEKPKDDIKIQFSSSPLFREKTAFLLSKKRLVHLPEVALNGI